jgi:hypothetical protein
VSTKVFPTLATSVCPLAAKDVKIKITKNLKINLIDLNLLLNRLQIYKIIFDALFLSPITQSGLSM